MSRIKTHCKALDILLDGGIPTGTITQLFGEKQLGKSILSLQSAFACVAEGHSAIIIDTELSYKNYLIPSRREPMARRFGRPIDIIQVDLQRKPRSSDRRRTVTRSDLVAGLSALLEKMGVSYTELQLEEAADALCPDFDLHLEGQLPAVLLLEVPTVEGLLRLHGVDAIIAPSRSKERDERLSTRMELRLRAAPSEQSPLRELARRAGARLLIYDSISSPLKATFPNTQDLPARSSSLAMILTHAQKLCVDYGMGVLITSHVSINPAQAWDRRPYGGAILGHEAKFSLEITRVGASRGGGRGEAVNPEDERDDEAARLLWIQRHPALPDYSKFGYAWIDLEGFH
jgi:hypothetical protein